MFLARYSIGAKIFAAFIAMGMLIALLGAAGYGVLNSAGEMAVTTFDGPLMAINYARAAQSDFIQIQVLKEKLADAAPMSRSALKAEIADLNTTFGEDLDVAEQRSMALDEKKLIGQIETLVDRWHRLGGDPVVEQKLNDQITAKFDLLIELNTDHSYVRRRQTVADVGNFKYISLGMTALALLLAAGITLLLRSRIVKPLAAAASVADRIARGELETPVPRGGGDETGVLLRSMTVMRDNISQMMARETSLRQSAENRLADALETSHEGVILVAADGNVVLANRALREFFPGIAQHLVGGAPFAEILELVQRELSPREKGRIDTSGHAELELADGRWVRLTASRTSEGGSIIFFSDFTLVKEREESLRRATAVAEAANAAKTRFLANMSHELRTPLNAIIGFSEIIHGQIFGAVGNERYLDYSGDILKSGRHLLSVINSVLDLSKSEAGKMSLNAVDVDMAEVLEDCIVMMREQLTEAGLSLDRSGLSSNLPLVGDVSKLRQIFLNLLSNAVKFTPRGGMVSLSAGRDTNGAVWVTVGDSGIGMSPEDLEVALQPFGQVDNRLERRYEGTGLGLPLTRAFVELHGGAMTFESARDSGTRVTVRFAADEKIALIA